MYRQGGLVHENAPSFSSGGRGCNCSRLGHVGSRSSGSSQGEAVHNVHDHGATISPGVSNTPAKQTLTVTTSLSGCTHSSVAGITSSGSNTTVSTGKKPETCASLATKSKPVKTVNTIDWNNGDTSVDSYSTTLDAGSATVKGKITSGTFDKGK